jgi:hypothetical protein
MEIKETYYIPEILDKYYWDTLINNIQFMLELALSKNKLEGYFFIDSFENFI